MAHKKFVYPGARKSAAVKPKAKIVEESFDKLPFKLTFCESHGELLSRRVLREKREEIQRRCALRRQRIMWQSLPKDERRALRQQARDDKYSFLNDEIEFQVGLPAIAGAISSLGVALSVGALSNKLRSKVDLMSDRVDQLIDTVTDTSQSINDTFSGVNSFFSRIADAVKAFIDLVRVIGGAFWQFVVGGLILAIRAASGVLRVVQDFVVGLVSRMVPDIAPALDFEEISMQQNGSLAAQVSSFICCVLLPCKMFSAKTRDQFVCNMARNLSGFTRTTDGFESIFNLVLQLVQSGLNFVLRSIGRDEVTLVGEAQAAVNKWCREVDAKLAQIDCDNPNVVVLTEAKALLGVGYNLKATLQAAHLRTTIERQLDRLNVKIAPFRGLLETENCYRAPPLLVMFGGESAVGKTHLIKAFASAVLQLAGLCKPTEVAQNMWQKGEDRFFNGYCGQLVYIMDDVFQKKAVKGSDECEGMTIIRAVNSWPFPLPFADVESKGRFFFSSKLMIGTTNQRNIQSDLDQVLAKPEAVLRRISHGYWLEVAPEYARETDFGTALDYKKLERVQREREAALPDNATLDEWLSCIPWEAWILKTHGFCGEVSTTQGPSMFSLVKEVAAELKERATRHVDTVQMLNRWLMRFPGGVEQQSGVAKNDLVYEATSFPVFCENTDAVDYGSVGEPEQCETPVIRGKREADRNKATAAWLADMEADINAERDYRRSVVYAVQRFMGQAVAGVKLRAQLAANGNVVAGLELLGMFSLALKCLKAIWGALGGVVRMLRSVLFGTSELVENQSVHSDKVYPVRKPSSDAVPSARAQMGNPPDDGASDRVFRNTWKLLIGVQSVGQVLMVRGKIGVMPYHFRQDLLSAERVDMIACSNASGGLRVHFSGKSFASFEHQDYPHLDLTFVDFSSVCAQAHRDIVKHFVTDRDVVRELKYTNNNFGVRLDIARPVAYNGEVTIERVAYLAQGLSYDPRIAVGYKDTEQLWTYSMPTQCGDCGAPLTIAEPRYFGGKSILGIHVAGKTRAPANGGQRQGWSAVLTKELVEKALSHFKPRVTIVDGFEEDAARKGITILPATEDIVEESGLSNCSMSPIGLVGSDCSISQSTRSKIKETGFTGFGPSPVAPAVLSPVMREDGFVQPMHRAMANYSKPLHLSFIKNPNAVMGLAMKKHWELTAESTRRILTDEEAVVGIPHLKLKSIKRSSSCGYPYNLKYTKGKVEIFGDGDEFDLASDAARDVLSEVSGIIADAKMGIRRAHIFVDFLKDETRPHAKIEAVATRAISGAPLDYSIAFRKYYGAFMSSVHMNHTRCGMAPGINHYTEWDVLATELTRHGERVFAGDFKAFDASEQPDIHQLCLRYINSWYAAGGGTAEDDLVREVLFQDLIHSRHLTGNGAQRDSIVQWHKSLPSGHPLTTIINSMYSLFTLTACYVKRTGDYTDMWSKAFICTYGDDNVVNVSDAVSEVFNQVTVAEDMRDFGLTYTSDRKDSTLIPYETIFDITFLKRSFRRAEIEGGWCAPLAIDSILYRTYYYQNNRSFKKDLETNFYDAFLELSLHPEEEWEDRFKVATEYCRNMGLNFPLISRDQARELCFARNDVWY